MPVASLIFDSLSRRSRVAGDWLRRFYKALGPRDVVTPGMNHACATGQGRHRVVDFELPDLAGLFLGKRGLPMRSLRTGFVLVGWALLATSSARSDDGVVEINQTCAVQTGCFSGDTAGLPVTITTAGSYRLTSNLVIPNDDTDGIRISTSDVGIDLNRFAVISSFCLDENGSCRPNAGTGTGIKVTSTASRGISVRNGSVTGLGDRGVQLGEQAVVSDLLVRWNGGDGILVDVGSSVSDSVVFANGGDGIVADSGSSVFDNTVNDNLSDGIDTGSGCSVRGNTARSNNGVGLRMGSQSAYRDNTLSSNGAGCVAGGVTTGGNACNGSNS